MHSFVLNREQVDTMKMKRKTAPKRPLKNPFGQYRKPPSIEEFRQFFERHDDVSVLGGFLNHTASWVQCNFPSIELELHQAATLGRAVRQQKNQKLEYQTVRAKFPRLAILASDADIREILENNPSPKEMTAEMLSRVLGREASSIKRWAQGKKQ